jgi:membrane protein DedA with SNARE-associated domain
MKHWKFLVFTFAGAGVWNTLLILGGQALAKYMHEADVVMDWVVGGTLVLVLGGYLYRVITWKPRG